MERENFYILLELEFDPPVTDPAQIKAAINEKRAQWTRLQDTPGRRGVALHYLELAGEMEQLMLDPAKRTAEAEAAKTLRAEMLTRFSAEAKVLESKGYITPRELAAIQQKYRPYGISKEKTEKSLNVPISETAPEKADEAIGSIIDRVMAQNIRRSLAIVGAADLYAFLGEEQYSSVKKLCDAAEARRREAAQSTSKNAYSTAAQELAGISLSLFESFDSKQRYDQYLKISGHPALTDLIDEEVTRTGFISPDVLLRLVNFGIETEGGTVLEFEQFIRRYCAAYDISVAASGRQISCPACLRKVSRDDAVCASCASPLQGSCPTCNTHFEGGVSICPICGFSLAEMVKALKFIDEAENALIDSNWSSAQRGLQYAHKYWPGHTKLEVLERRAKRLEERYASYVESIADCIKHRQYYAALELVQEAQARRIRLPAATVSHVEKVINDIELRVTELQSDPEAITFERIYALIGMVSDSIELDRLLSKYPPEPPPRLIAQAQGKQVRLSWEKTPSSGMIQYVVVRKHSTPPLTAYDGDVLYEGASNSFVDKTLQPLTECWYCVYVKRGSTFSLTGAVAEVPVLIVPEVEELRILPTNCGAQLSWRFSPDIREVKIWRKLGGEPPTEGGDGVLLECDRLDGFADMKLRNDIEYWYYVAAVYVVGGKKISSHGVYESVTPHAIVAPIEYLTVLRTDNDADEYVANWEEQHSDVLLMASPTPVTYRSGQMVSVDELLTKYRKLDIDARGRNSARFHFSFNGGMYLFAVAVSGRFATVGTAQYITSVRDVISLNSEMIGEDLMLTFPWPDELPGVEAAWRYDNFPQLPDEPGATPIYCSREQYTLDDGLCIREPEPGIYYFTLFSVFITPGGEKVYSKGRELMVDTRPQQEVFYEFKYTKPFFSSAYTITLTIRSDEDFTLPRAVIVGKIGRLPLKRTDGMPMFELEKETRVRGSISFEYKTSLLPQDLYIRLFLYDDKMYERYRLLPASDMKIT